MAGNAAPFMNPWERLRFGLARLQAQDWQEAECCFDRLHQERPPGLDLSRVRLVLAAARHGQNKLMPAMQLLLPLLGDQRDSRWFVEALLHYGSLCFELGLAQHWLDCCDHLGVSFDPGPETKSKNPQLVAMRGAAKLLVGDYRGGWADSEARSAVGMSRSLTASMPRWLDGQRNSRARLLLLADQGFGDLLFSLRFVPLLRQQVGFLQLACPPGLGRFMEQTQLFDVVQTSDVLRPAAFDCCEYLTSLPVLLGIDSPDQVPPPILNFASESCADWIMALSSSRNDAPLVALNWQGGKAAESIYSGGIRERSFPAEALEQVRSLQRCDLLSVQVGEAAQEIQGTSLAPRLVPQQGRFDATPANFFTTASVLMRCDLLITNDTSVAHLGGCLGLPTWVVLRKHPSWHWGDAGEWSPWYPSLRCFRQSIPFDWSSALRPLDQALAFWLSDWRRRRGIPESPDP